MRKALKGLYWTAGLLACLSLAMIVLLVLAQICSRWVGLQVKSADEIAGYFLAASLFLALAPTFRKGEHIRVGLVLDRLGAKAKRLMDIVCLVFTAALIGYFTQATIGMVWTSYAINDVSQGLLPIPLWIPQLAMAAGLFIFLIAILDDLVAVLTGSRPSFAQAQNNQNEEGEVALFER